MGGTRPPLTEIVLASLEKHFPKRAKNDGFVLNKIKNGQKGHIIDQKRLKIYENLHK